MTTEADSEPIEGTVVCGAMAASCRCILPPHNEGTPHECNPDVCSGSWSGDYSTGRDFRIVRIPERQFPVRMNGVTP